MTLLQYWKENFSNSAGVLSACLYEIDSLSSAFGFQFSDIVGDLTWVEGQKFVVPMGLIEKTGRKAKDSVAVYANIVTFRNGMEFPSITITRKGTGGEKIAFSGYDFIVSEYENDGGNVSDQGREEKQKLNEALKSDLEEKKKASQARNAIENEKKKALHFDYLELFESSPKATSKSINTAYARKKGIIRALAACGAKQFNDSHLVDYGRDCMAVKFRNAYRTDVGLQKIYSDGFKQQSDSYTEKGRTDTQFHGAFVPFGKIDDDPQVIQYAEGMATAASCYLANKEVTLFCINADNMMIVVGQMLAQYPDAKHVVLADNDNATFERGKGNKGVKIAHQIKAAFRDKVRVVVAQPVGDGSDFNDIHQDHKNGLREVAKQIKGRKGVIKVADDIFQQALKELYYTNPDAMPGKADKAKEIKKVVNAGLALFPRFYTKEAIILAITNGTEHFKNLPLTDVLTMIDRRCKGKANAAQRARGFSRDTINDQQINYIKFNEGRVTPEVLACLNSLNGITILRAPMASGKTQVFIKSAFRKKFDMAFAPFTASAIRTFEDDLFNEFLDEMAANGYTPNFDEFCEAKVRVRKEIKEHCQRVEKNHTRGVTQRYAMSAYLAHRRTLVGSAATDLSDKAGVPGAFTVSHYQDDKGLIKSGGQLEQLACCANSITNPLFDAFFNKLDQLFVDEGSQTIRHICSGGAVDNPKRVFDKLLGIVRNTPTVVFCDADADDLLVEFCKIATPDKKINIVELTTDCSHLTINVTETKNIYTRVLADLKAGEPIFMATDNANFAENLADTIKTEFKGKKRILFISANTKHEDEVTRFCDNPNAEGKNYDAIIYSPAISSGVSFQADYFLPWNTYAAFYGVVSPSDAIQMIRRNRKAASFTIGLGSMNSREADNEDDILLGMAAANGEQPEIDHENFTITTTFTPFDSLRAKVLAMEGKLRNDFANIFLLSLMNDGYQINHLDKDLLAENTADAKMKEARERLTDAKHLAYELNTTPDQLGMAALMLKKSTSGISSDEQKQCDRYNIENILQMGVNEDSIKFYEQGGMKKAANYDLLRMTTDETAAIDKQEISNKVPKSMRQYLTNRRNLTRKIISIAGFNLDDFSGEVTAGQIKDAIDWLRADAARLANYNAYNIGPHINPHSTKQQPTTIFDGVLAKLGLKTAKGGRRRIDGRKQTLREIDSVLIHVMAETHKKRKAANVQSHHAKLGASDDEINAQIYQEIHVQKMNEKDGHTLDCVYNTNSKEYVHTFDLAVARVVEVLQSEISHTFLEVRRWFTKYDKEAFESGQTTLSDLFEKVKIHSGIYR